MRKKFVTLGPVPFLLPLFLILFSALFSMGCNTDGKTEVQFVTKTPPEAGAGAKILGSIISEKELFKGVEQEIFEAEQKLYEIKMAQFRAFLLKTFMEKDERYKGLSEEEFLDKFISQGKGPTKEEIDQFIAQRQIPSTHVNDELKERVKKFLSFEQKKKDVEIWLAEKTKENPVEVYFSAPQRPVFSIPIENSPALGSDKAKVTIVEFSDFQCPFCAKASKVFKEIKDHFGPDKIKFVFKHFPLDMHPQAKPAGHAALCAKEQGGDEQFFKMYYALFDGQDNLKEDGIKEKAKKIGLDMTKFETCLKDMTHMKQIEADFHTAQELGLRAAPSFFINGKLYSGVLPFEELKEIIEDEIKAAK